MNTNKVKISRTPQEYEALKFDAQVLYVKEGLSAKEICNRLNLSMPTLQKWNDAGRWKELRPDFELLNQHKAAGLFIEKGLPSNEIAEKLSISEITIKLWIFQYSWEAARLISQAQNINLEIVSAFCDHFNKWFPEDTTKIQVAKESYLKSLAPKI